MTVPELRQCSLGILSEKTPDIIKALNTQYTGHWTGAVGRHRALRPNPFVRKIMPELDRLDVLFLLVPHARQIEKPLSTWPGYGQLPPAGCDMIKQAVGLIRERALAPTSVQVQYSGKTAVVVKLKDVVRPILPDGQAADLSVVVPIVGFGQ